MAKGERKFPSRAAVAQVEAFLNRVAAVRTWASARAARSCKSPAR